MNVLETMEQEQIAKLLETREIPEFAPGDTVRVALRVVEGTRERIQNYEGVCIARKNRGLNSSFTVRKISYGEGVEQVFPLYSQRIASITVVRRGAVRRTASRPEVRPAARSRSADRPPPDGHRPQVSHRSEVISLESEPHR